MHSSTAQVSMYKTFLSKLVDYFQNKANSFKVGGLTTRFGEWQSLVSDPEIQETVSRQKIKFSNIPVQTKPLMNVKFTEKETKLVVLKIRFYFSDFYSS